MDVFFPQLSSSGHTAVRSVFGLGLNPIYSFLLSLNQSIYLKVATGVFVFLNWILLYEMGFIYSKLFCQQIIIPMLFG